MLRLSLILIFLLVPALIASAVIKPENVMGVWLLDEGKGDLADDISGNKHEGKMVGAKWTDGKFGKALLFEGAGEVKIASTEKLSLGDQFTMMAFFNTDALNDWHQIIAKDAEYLLRLDPPAEGTKMSAFVNLAGGWEPRASAIVPVTKTWYHFAAAYSSKTQKLIVYVDGVKAGETGRAGKPGPNNNPVTFGHWNNGSRFRGIIDDVGIFNVALEEDEVKSIFENGLKAAIGGAKSVQFSGKLASAWGDVKTH